jgi:hypothetical protein
MEKYSKLKTKLDKAAYMIRGSYSSESQHTKEPLGFYHIIMHIYPIWEERTDGRWFYVEQALSSLQNEPYRQRIYKLNMIGRDTVTSDVYNIPEPERFVGAWKCLVNKSLPDAFKKLKASELTSLDGCTVYLTQNGEAGFKGGTHSGSCTSKVKDSKFMISEIDMTLDKLVTWDRGYNDKGVQVWGAKSGYIFDALSKCKITELIQGKFGESGK